MDDFWHQVQQTTHDLTERIGLQLLQDFGQVQADEKQDGSLVTRADRWADHEFCQAIADRFPEHGILSEEASNTVPDTEWCWIIDPIDGTTNFTRGVPLWALSIGLAYQGTPVYGHVYVPTLQQHFQGFWGAPGHSDGAWCNQRGIRVKSEPPAPNQLFSFCARSLSAYRKPFPCKVRMLGVASYNLLTVAAGIGIGAVEATPKIWDIAGVWPILNAAGASWIPLESDPIFPLAVGQDYGQRSFPTLAVSQAEWAEQFLPYLRSLWPTV